MSSLSQEELNEIWTAILGDKYGHDPTAIMPKRIVAEEHTDIMSIPNRSGTQREVYERKRGNKWEQVAYIGERAWPVVKGALENPRYKWRTIEGISAEIGLDPLTVAANVASQTDQVIKSSIPDKEGRDLFTTRTHYREKSTLLERLESALTNKVQK